MMLSIPLNNQLSIPLYEQIYRFLKQEITTNQLKPNMKLPSTRNLASFLQVSRNTVDLAYSQLVSEGYIYSLEKKGYFVNSITGLAKSSEFLNTAPVNIPNKQEDSSILYDLSPFGMDLNHFPYHTWTKLTKKCLMEQTDLFVLGNNQGDLPFRLAIQSYLHQSRGVNCEVDQIIVGAGVDYLLQLLTHILDSTYHYAMENPTYQRAYKILTGYGRTVHPISLDEQGIDVNQLMKSKANVAYVTPSHQYPLGIVMPIKRRLELLSWAKEKEDRYIIEDDHDSEFRYKGKPIPSLQGIDSNDKVIYIGTFSRAIAPAIRIGYMVLPKQLSVRYQNNYNYYSCTVSRIDQAILTRFIEDGYFERHLNRMRKIYKGKHDLMVSSLKSLGKKVTIYGENAGLHLVLTFHTSKSEQQFIELAKQHELKLYSLSQHYIGTKHQLTNTFLVGFATLSDSSIESICRIFQQIL